ncbi:hypothetical protein BOX15_Mlig001053g3 [Macrostomum lignano]|uniref:Uncharacterized protein n=1 Tax=Macrostomum lignano TaxID=282301 RepID=A0A267DYN3_9PLAT|nr:hypothetical protein BOX15_Mlig001053g3 [Macrostomum lignano]
MCCEQTFYYLAFPLIRRSKLPPDCCLPVSQRVYRHLVLYRKMEAERLSKQTHLPVALRLQKYSSNRDSLLLSGDAISSATGAAGGSSTFEAVGAATAEPESVMSGLSGLTYSNRMLLNNIAVQTDLDDCISSQLEDVDAEICRRSDQFQRDMHGMRERVAQLLHDREVLVRRLALFEGKSRAAIEEELQQQLAEVPGSSQQQQGSTAASSGGRRLNIELTHNNLLSRSRRQKCLTKSVLL